MISAIFSKTWQRPSIEDLRAMKMQRISHSSSWWGILEGRKFLIHFRIKRSLTTRKMKFYSLMRSTLIECWTSSKSRTRTVELVKANTTHSQGTSKMASMVLILLWAWQTKWFPRRVAPNLREATRITSRKIFRLSKIRFWTTTSLMF